MHSPILRHSLLLILLTFLKLPLYAQIVTEDVHFDFYQNASNNDLVNNFNGAIGITQLQNNGITGGCLDVPDSINWGNDNAIYCSHYNPGQGDTAITEICFKYDSASVQLSSFQRAASIFLNPWADFNHYVIATVSGSKKIEIITYGWVNTPYPSVSLFNNHWYRLRLSTAFFPASANVYINAEVFDLGIGGTGFPSLVNSSNGTISDNILSNDTAIQVSVTGAGKGGCAFLDDFRFNGRKGMSNCIIPTGAINQNTSVAASIYYMAADRKLHILQNSMNQQLSISIYNSEGKKVFIQNTSASSSEFDVSFLRKGIYLVLCRAESKCHTLKFFVK